MNINDFKVYKRTQNIEMRPVTEWDIKAYKVDKEIYSIENTNFKVSISDADRHNGSPKIGDMIARNPKDHNDQWLVAKQYFEDNFASPMLGVILTYGLFFDKNRLQWTTIEATKYDEQTNEPISWAVRQGGSAMSKFTGNFDYEPMPSNRDDNFFNEYRFSTPDEAAQCWSKYYGI
jgi:hypothetical protein